jgi:hypothetical protein
MLYLMAMLLCSCATATITTKHVDGKQTECTGTYFSLFKDVSVINLSVCGSKGNSSGSTVNTALAGELFKVLLAVP